MLSRLYSNLTHVCFAAERVVARRRACAAFELVCRVRFWATAEPSSVSVRFERIVYFVRFVLAAVSEFVFVSNVVSIKINTILYSVVVVFLY